MTPDQLPTFTPLARIDVTDTANELNSRLGSMLSADRGQSSEPIHIYARMVPSVGILWAINEGDRGGVALFGDSSELADAETYGDCLKHLEGHY